MYTSVVKLISSAWCKLHVGQISTKSVVVYPLLQPDGLHKTANFLDLLSDLHVERIIPVRLPATQALEMLGTSQSKQA